MPAQWLDGLTKDQKIRIELLLEELIVAGARRQAIRNIVKRALYKEIRFAAHPPRVLKNLNHARETKDASSQRGETRKTEREVLL